MLYPILRTTLSKLIMGQTNICVKVRNELLYGIRENIQYGEYTCVRPEIEANVVNQVREDTWLIFEEINIKFLKVYT